MIPLDLLLEYDRNSIVDILQLLNVFVKIRIHVARATPMTRACMVLPD
jgi:hypothetical protein